MSITSRRWQRGALHDVPSFVYTRNTQPDRTEVHDTSGNWLATFTDGSRTVNVKGAERTFTEMAMPIYDDFQRTLNTKWGAMTKNATWSLWGATNASFSVAPGAGRMALSVPGISARATTLTHPIVDADVRAMYAVDQQAAGASITASLIAGYQDSENYYYARVEHVPSDKQVVDSFTRTTSSSWGAADSGQTWGSSGSAVDFSCDGATGVHTLTSFGVSRRSFTGSATDFVAETMVSSSALAAGSSLNGGIIGRYIDADNHYIFRIRFSPSQFVYGAIQGQVGGTVTTLGAEVQAAGLTHTVGTFYRIKAEALGSTLRMKIWQDGQAEPADWLISVTDTAISSAGGVGVRSIVNTGVTTPLPIAFKYDDFSATLDGGGIGDAVRLRIYKDAAGSLAALSPVADTGMTYSVAANDKLWIRFLVSGGVLQAKTWKDGTSEPAQWQATANDASFATGRAGVRSLLSTGSTTGTVNYSWMEFSCDGAWHAPPTVIHDKWVRIAPTPFDGAVDETWLSAQLANTEPDVLATAMQYIHGAPAVTDGELVIAGDADYGPLLPSGGRSEGGDFNDYLGIPWTYTGVDNPEADQFNCMDCSGYIRMVYGYRLGMPMSLTAVDGARIPRVSNSIMTGGPGTMVIAHTGATAPADFGSLLPGDIVGFDADTTNPDEVEGQIDHVGIYMGIATDGKHRFISSRQSPNGPTFADVGGYSYFGEGTALYSRSVRAVRRF